MLQLFNQDINYYKNSEKNNHSNVLYVLDQLKTDLLAMEDENSTLRKIFATNPNAILITNSDVEITYVNPAWEQLTGYTFDEVKGKNPKLLQSGKTPQSYYKKLWKSLTKGKPFISEDVIDKRKDGTFYNIHSTIYPVHKNRKIACYIQVQHDITGRVRMDELKSQFLSVVSHELKTPITVLKLLSQSQLAKARKDGTVILTKEELEMYDQELNKLTLLINDLLDNTRIESGKLRMNFEIFDITALTQAAIDKISIIKKDHRFTFDSNTPKYFVIGDKQRIEQVLINLLNNATKYSPEGSTISVQRARKQSHIVVSVKDKGIGIAKKNQKAIFDKYFQVSNRNGFGIGLYISKAIIKQHKGKIWVESEEGKGSTFFFSLPLQKGGI